MNGYKPCKNFAKYQGIREPRCNCYPCFYKYFLNHEAFVAAMLSMFIEGRKEDLKKLHGDKLVKFMEHFLVERGMYIP